MSAMQANPVARLWNAAVWIVTVFFLFNVGAMIAMVLLNSFAARWFNSWLPGGLTARWYSAAWGEFQLGDLLIVTMQVTLAVVALSALIGIPAAYALARANFPGKRLASVLFLLPMMIPPITYGIPLATVLYQVGLGGTLAGVIIANLVPTVPFVILVMTPFIEQIDTNLESAARMLGASTGRMFVHVLVPLLAPGILAASLIVMVRTIGMFELTFLTAGPDSQTLVVALYYAAFAPGVRAGQSISAMAVVYMLLSLAWLVIALRFVNPTQLVTRVKS